MNVMMCVDHWGDYVAWWCPTCDVGQDSEYVVAVRNYITEERTLLNFHKGDIIRLQHMDGLEAGEQNQNTETCFLLL